MSRLDLASHFLPGADRSTGPFGLLALPVEIVEPAAVDDALAKRLAEIARHPQAASEEAQAVRDSLFVAAAQLRDPAVQRALVMRLTGRHREPTAPAARDAGSQATPEPLTQEEAGAVEYVGRGVPIDQFRLAARHVLAATGGWNAQSKRRLGALAQGEHVDASQLRRVLVDINRAESGRAFRHGASPSHTPAGANRSDRPADAQSDPQDASNAPHDHPADRRHAREALIATSHRHLHADAIDAAPRSPQWRAVINVATVVLFITTGILLVSVGIVIADRNAAASRVNLVTMDAPGRPDDADPNRPAGNNVDAPPPERVTANDVAEMGAAVPTRELGFADAKTLYRAFLSLDPDAFADDRDAALRRFEAAIKRLSTAWPDFEPGPVEDVGSPIADAIEAAQTADPPAADDALGIVVELALRLDRADRESLPIARDDVLAYVFAAALLDQLADDLPPALAGDAADAALRAFSGDDSLRDARFRAGAVEAPAADGLWRGVELALYDTATRLVDQLNQPQPPDGADRAWAGLADAAAAFAAAQPTRGAAFNLATLEALLKRAPSPGSSRAAAAAYDAMLAATRWAGPDGEPARRRLVRWYRDEALPADRLSELSSRLIDAGRLQSLGPEQRFPADAAGAARDEAATRLARALGLPDADPTDRFIAEWSAQADAIADDDPRSPHGRALLTAASARLNHAAAAWWAGRDADAGAALAQTVALRNRALTADDASRPPNDADLGSLNSINRQAPVGAAAGPEGAFDPADPDGRWAQAFLNQRRDRDRAVALLNQLQARGGEIGRVDAAVLSDAALRMTPTSARAAAQRAALRYTDQRVMIAALLEGLPDAAEQRDVSDMIERITGDSLPDPREDAWRPAARAALLVHLIDMLDTPGGPALDAAAAEIAAAHRNTAALVAPAAEPSSDDQTNTTPPPMNAASGIDALDAASSLRDAWARRARTFAQTGAVFADLVELERLHRGRLDLAEGPIQRFTAEQAAAAELMAWTVSVERASQAAQVADRVRAFRSELAAAGDAFRQILASERLMNDLWLLRLGADERTR